MNQSVVKQLAVWVFMSVLLMLLPSCGQPSTDQSDSDPSLNTFAKPKDKNHKPGGIITTAPDLPEVEEPDALEAIDGEIPVTNGVSLQATGDQIQLKFLLIGLDSSDFGIDTWTAVLKRVGASYDILLAKDTPLTSGQLIDPNGVGKYNAILLTNNSLLYQDGTGFVSAFDANEWNTLWSYERTYAVRQVSLYTSYGTFPEDYCLRASSEGGVGTAILNATLTAAGTKIMPELRSSAQIPITLSYVYRTTLAAGCSATPILTLGSNVLGVTTTSSDGRERAALTFSSNMNLLQSTLLTYSLLRWASKGVFLGERKHYLNVDVDDWFNTSDERLPDGSFVPNGYRNTPQDFFSVVEVQKKFNDQYKGIVDKFQLNMAYNGGDADLNANDACDVNKANKQNDPLTSATICKDDQFNWINHTLTHLKLNDPSIATVAAINTEISQNLAVAKTLKINVRDTSILKTGEYSGLGVYNPDPNNDIDPPTDFGLMASNPNLLLAAKNNSIKYLHGNMSFESHRPTCFNCSVYHPMNTQLGTNVLIVPDWPTNIAYLATNPMEEESIYNCFFGPTGTCAGGRLRFWPRDLTYSEIIEAESDLAFQQHLATGAVNTHTMHAGNLREYTSKRNLVFDWLDRTVAKYATYYDARLLNPTWTELASYAADRSSHFGLLVGGVKAVWDRATNRVSITSPVPGTVFITGVDGTGKVTYSSDTISRLNLAAGQSLSFAPSGYVKDL